MGGGKFIFTQGRTTQRASVYGGGQTVYEFVPRPEWGSFETRAQAKRWYVSGADPDPVFKTCEDSWIARHFKTMSRNHKVRIIRVSQEQSCSS